MISRVRLERHHRAIIYLKRMGGADYKADHSNLGIKIDE